MSEKKETDEDFFRRRILEEASAAADYMVASAPLLVPKVWGSVMTNNFDPKSEMADPMLNVMLLKAAARIIDTFAIHQLQAISDVTVIKIPHGDPDK